MTYIAPAGTVIEAADLLHALGISLRCRADGVLADLLQEISGAARCLPISSGRAAMTMIFKAMRQARRTEPQRDEVIIPAYTCYSVAAAAIRAGLTPRLCDVDPSTLGMDPQALENTDFTRVLAVVSANLYGVPDELEEIERIARDKGVYMLDDAAQALGARIAERAVGTFGDAGLFSFDKGKIICTIQGGAIVTGNSEVGNTIAEVLQTLPRSSLTETLLNYSKLLAYAVLLRPRYYGLVQRLPFLGLGKTIFETRYPIARLSGLQAAVAIKLAERLDDLNDERRRNAERLRDALHGLSGIMLPAIGTRARAVYARFPIRITDPARREPAVSRLNRHGIGATTSYPLALADVPEVRAVLRDPAIELPGAREIARQIVTLPTHGYCPPELGARIARLLNMGADPALAYGV